MSSFYTAIFLFWICSHPSLVAAMNPTPSERPPPISPTFWNNIECEVDREENPRLADCQAAIDLIPSGTFRAESHLHLTGGLPSRTCVVTVRAHYTRNQVPNPPQFTNAASKMYSIVWPNVKRRAEQISEECAKEAPPQPGDCVPGDIMTGTWLGEAWFPMIVYIWPRPKKDFPGDGWKVMFPENDLGMREKAYHVYEPGGMASGVGKKGIGRPYGTGWPT